MKKTFTLLSMLLCFFVGMHAQTAVSYVSTTATPYSDLVSGKEYAILVASDKNCTGTDYSTARFLSGSGTSTAFADAYTSTNDLRGAIAAANYIWVVTINDDNTIKLNVKNGNYIPAPPSNGQNGGQLSTSGGSLTRVTGPTENPDWCYLTAGTVTVSNEQKTIYLNLGGSKLSSSSNKLEYWHYNSSASFATNEVAKFKFFAIEEGLESVNLTYNYTINGTKVGSATVTGVVGKPLPTPTGLPDFVTASAPEGTVTADAGEQTVELNLTNYPFPFSLNESDESKWGYLSANISTNARCFLTAGAQIGHTSTNGKNVITTLNNVPNDMWRMVGNPFDGFKIMNQNGNCLVKNSGNNGASLTAASSTESNNLWKVFGGDIISDANSITDANKAELKSKAFVLRNSAVADGESAYLDGGGISSKASLSAWQKRSNGACFLFWEPEFTVALNTTDNLDAAYATLCMPVDFKVTTEGVKAYTGKYSDGTLNMTAVEGGVAANQGVVLRSGDKSITTVTLTANAGTTTTSDNDLQGTNSEIAFANLSDKLVFGVSAANKVGFFSAGGSAALPANRAYLNKSLVNNGGNAIVMNFGGTSTGIDAIEGVKTTTNAAIYDLTGRRVMRTAKGGLYIQNGKKFIAQ